MIENIGAYSQVDYDRGYQQGRADAIDEVIEKITAGLDEGIRCAMCTNTMANDRGCDGGCVVDKRMYEKVMEVIDKNINSVKS